MFRRFKEWLQGGAVDHRQQAEQPVEDDERTDIPDAARLLADRIVRIMLKCFEAEERASDIETVPIAAHRILLQVIPLRVYVYALGSMMGDMEFDSMLRSQRPAGAVFDAFEITVEGVRCGFYVYSLQPVADKDLLKQVWREVRRETGNSARTAALPESHTRHHGTDAVNAEESGAEESDVEFHSVNLDGDPEEIAAKLIGPTLWKKPLAGIDLSAEQGQADLVARFVIRDAKASVEKDELIQFVEKNRATIPSFVDGVLGVLADAAKAQDGGEEMALVMQHFREQVDHAYRGDFDKIQTRSDRVFWLIYVLAAQLGSKHLSYAAAVDYLRKQPHRSRITPMALQFMIHDYAESIDKVNRPSTEMLMLVGEAACLIEDLESARAALGVVLRLGTAGHRDTLLEYVARMEAHLGSRGVLDAEDEGFIRRIRDRYGTRIRPEDF